MVTLLFYAVYVSIIIWSVGVVKTNICMLYSVIAYSWLFYTLGQFYSTLLDVIEA